MTSIRSIAAFALAGAVVCSGARAQTPIPPSPKDFVLAATQGDQYEIMAGHLAVVQAQDPRVRAFAETMIRDHARLTDALHKAASDAGLPPPEPAMSSDQAALLAGLQGLRGAEFDKAYARQQVLAHVQAATVEESFADAGTDATLKKAAQSALPTIKDHLALAQQLRTEVGGS